MRQAVPIFAVALWMPVAGAAQLSVSDPQLAQRLADAEHGAALVPWLLGLVVVLGAAVFVLGWRLLRRRTSAQHPEPMPVSDSLPLPSLGESTVAIVTAAQPREAPAVHGLSIEEHIDVDQQAQFLLVIGQDEAAIDLLLEHLRGTGGTSPLPYLRLMQIYRKRGDQAAYERTRERFNLRFNALAPQWQAETGSEETLQAYPQILAEIQRAWSSPLDAMAVIESLLFRRGSEDERFALPAYEELLFLYWLTRELQQLGDAPPSQVDVLLPIDDASAESSVIEREAPRRASATAYDSTAVFTQLSVNRPPASPPVDLDLTTVPGPPDGDIERY